MKSHKLILVFGLFTILIIGSLMQHSVLAQEDDNDDDEDETEEIERSITVDHRDDRVEIESSYEEGGNEDEIEIEIEIVDEPEISLEYNSEVGSTETEAEMKVKLYSLIEFLDENDNGVYDGDDVDILVQTYRLDQVDYDPISYTTNDLGSGATEHVISFRTSDGVFKTVVHIVGQFTNIGGTDLQPTSLKIDYIITDFNFTEADSKLALFSEVETSTEIETESDTDADGQIEDDEDAVIQGGDEIFAFYSWEKTAQVDGSTTDVLASFEDISQSDKEIYLNYEQGSEIIHDPKLGVSLSSSSGSSSLLSYTPIIVILGSMLLLAIGKSFRRK